MNRRIAIGAAASLPFVWIAARESGRLLGLFQGRGRPMAAFWIFLCLIVLALVWSSVFFLERASRRREEAMPFDVVAAVAMKEAGKRGPAPKCPACGRPRLAAGGGKCLYCGTAWSDGGSRS